MEEKNKRGRKQGVKFPNGYKKKQPEAEQVKEENKKVVEAVA